MDTRIHVTRTVQAGQSTDRRRATIKAALLPARIYFTSETGNRERTYRKQRPPTEVTDIFFSVREVHLIKYNGATAVYALSYLQHRGGNTMRHTP